ncbi:hypothetical protein TELCIR_13359, partial [Teladorsagia circumcincta]
MTKILLRTQYLTPMGHRGRKILKKSSDEDTLPLISATVAINALAIIINFINEQINLSYFKRATAQNGPNEYSLAERYQISENIKTSKGFKTALLSILGFNLVCIGAVVIDNFGVTTFVRNIANTALNYATLILSQNWQTDQSGGMCMDQYLDNCDNTLVLIGVTVAVNAVAVI